ncbi:DEAD/DEAH box helicase [Jeotgalibacillus campisalis]|uniref:ATP-dependent RNA helicase DbpA n=1 Tax=Jeotgalibacillus campisalis TaxID=220754 RepID=A0A0C2SGI0_9BACL|nr:DEAD/DEAH box helicase [Jeotgalibacillus campisalis]KIL53019.1 RNA helicase [Jeotgalibacillus campisalis]
MTEINFNDFAVSQDILSALDLLEYKQPTAVQQKVIPVVLDKKDAIVKSKTGSGKTAAFGIPLCELAEWEENKPQALILTPTRELADQIKEDITAIGRFKRIKAIAIYGKQPFAHQKTELKQKNHIVAGTPGRVLDHIQKGTIAIDKIDYLIIDEADEMLSMGFIDQVEAIIKELPSQRTTMLFSATLPEEITKLSDLYMNNPEKIEIDSSHSIDSHISHSMYRIDSAGKLGLLKAITVIENPDTCIIFCSTKDRVDELVEELDRTGYTCDKLHGGMIQEDRFAVMNDFKRGDFRYLIATDVAARGIDIENVSLVVNYDFPSKNESYVHRIGRTGRAGKSGNAITFVTPKQEHYLAELETFIGFKLIEKTPPLEEEIALKKSDFENKMDILPEAKTNKKERVSEDIMKLYFNGGKKKKLRAVDFVGTIAKLDGIHAQDIGIITIQENVTYVEILNGKGPLVLQKMKNTTVKGKQLKVHLAREK